MALISIYPELKETVYMDISMHNRRSLPSNSRAP